MAQPTGIYGWIRSNDGRSTGFFVAFVVAMQIVAAMVLFVPLTLWDPGHAPFFDWAGYLIRYSVMVFAASIVWFGWQMFWHIEAVKRAVGFHFVDAADEPRLCRLIEPLIMMSDLPVPFVGVIESDARNAFACGIGRKKAVIVVTRGLIASLDDEELACVLGHKISHIKNGDIRLMAAANICLSALTRMHCNNPLKFTPIHMVLAIALPAILPLSLIGGFLGHLAVRAGQVSRLMIASAREFIADAEAVQLTKNPAAMASALVKVEHDYRIKSARPEDDSMMIAGDTEGGNATHPTVAHRVSALARITGSMVFNAPGAITARAWDESKSLSEAKTAALLHRLPKVRALPRVRAGAAENFLGLTKLGTAALLATIAILAWIHSDDLCKPAVMASKFDLRPLSILLTNPLSCAVSGERITAQCSGVKDGQVYKDFEGQKNTLGGFLAEASRKRREAGIINADLTLANYGNAVVVGPYAGRSGKLRNTVSGTSAQNDFFAVKGRPGAYQIDDTPGALAIAELDGVGCYSNSMFHGKPEGHFPFGQVGNDTGAFDRYAEKARLSAVPYGIPGTAANDDWLRGYARGRQNLLNASYDMWGFEGLRAMREIYREPSHDRVLEELRARLTNRAFTTAMTPLDVAGIRALTRNSEHFIPCVAVKHGAMDRS